MDYRPLGRSGLKVSTLCLGTMTFGGPTDAAEAERIVGRAREAGVNFIDTADAYEGGRSEEEVGRLIAPDRDRWVLATKLYNPTGPGPNDRGLTRKRIFLAAEASLRRLRTDAIDLYYLHRDDAETPHEETVRALADLIRAGKVRYIGLSNFKAWRLARFCAACDAAGIDRPIASQPLYNALDRSAEAEHLPACSEFGLGVVPYSPLARGVLTAKYAPGTPPPEGSRAGRKDPRLLQTEWRPESLDLAQKIAAHARAKGRPASHLALAWLLNSRPVSAVIAGPRTAPQWEDYLAALDYPYGADDEALIEALVRPGHSSTPGYTDPLYPVTGRAPRRR